MNATTHKTMLLALLPMGFAAGLAALSGCSTMNTETEAGAGQTTFRTPEAAVAALADVAGTGDQAKAEAIFGAGSADLIRSGDEVADRERALEVKALIGEKVGFEDIDEKTKAPLLGNEEWSFPIPLVKVSGGWRFDTERGREEVENRRVGHNELSALATLHAVVDAQREYRAARRGGYAQRVISSRGKQDGLYWPTPEGKPSSPLGPLVAEATKEGYSTDNEEPQPYHGYYFRMLTAQGPSAPGGAKSYVDSKGSMTKGFAMVAWPAKYGNSGRMTFLVNHNGIVFETDLGEQTASAAKAITAFDPNDDWEPTGD